MDTKPDVPRYEDRKLAEYLAHQLKEWGWIALGSPVEELPRMLADCISEHRIQEEDAA
jgi:hypothetical protein